MEDVMDAGLVVEEIWISGGHDFKGRHGLGREENEVVRVDEVECVTGMGLEGDRYFGFKKNYKGQVTFFAMEMIEELREKYGEVRSSVVRRNVLVRGGDLPGLLGRRFAVQGVVFEGSEECRPCYWMEEAVGPGAEDFLKGNCRGGIRARIVKGGRLRAKGDQTTGKSGSDR
jgi:MOSC domain-containing protein YiiM